MIKRLCECFCSELIFLLAPCVSLIVDDDTDSGSSSSSRPLSCLHMTVVRVTQTTRRREVKVSRRARMTSPVPGELLVWPGPGAEAEAQVE